MDSVREKITIELARSKIRTEEIYAIIKQIADHIEPVSYTHLRAHEPGSTSSKTSASTSASAKINCKENCFSN